MKSICIQLWGTLALRVERQSAEKSETKNGRLAMQRDNKSRN